MTLDNFDFRKDRKKYRNQCNRCRADRAKELRRIRREKGGNPNLNTEQVRKCSTCREVKLLSLNNFHPDKTRLYGFSYVCRICEKKRSRTAKRLISSYRTADKRKNLECDLTEEFVQNEILNKECTYCGETEDIGIDRIDNSIGHTMENSIPCCPLCNRTRGDNFTIEEMMLIGETIKTIYKNRSSSLAINRDEEEL